MTRPAPSTPACVLHRIAAAILPPPAPERTRLGAFVLRPAQERSLRGMLDALREFGGVLVADPPGTGKTVLALAAARAVGGPCAALVVAPAALRAQWCAAAARAEVAIAFASLESLSRGAAPAHAGTVIVDEAHHARTPGARRYARLAACCLGARVILLSATPVVNRGADRDALLALFLGARSARLTPAEASRCVLRVREPALRPAVRRLGVIGRGVDVPGLADALATLPPPLPMAGTAAAGALVAMSLAMAWRSSLAALDAALRRRIQRGEAMRDLLRAGARPSHAMLRHWVLHDDATQLAMERLFATPASVDSGRDDADAGLDAAAAPARELETLDRHLAAVRELRERIAPHRAPDVAARAAAIRELAARHPGRRLVVFARHARTVVALHAALRGEPGVVAIVGARVLAAAGRWTRDEVLRELGPRARPLDARDPRAIRILLATDVVAEGVEMQGIGIVVHADLPWTPARIEQRLGRVARAGSGSREVLEGRLAAPRGAARLIRLGARLLGKARARWGATRDARARAGIAAILEQWRQECAPTGRGTSAPASGAFLASISVGGCTLAAGDGDDQPPPSGDRFVALVEPEREGDREPWLLVGERGADRWRVSASPRRVRRVLREIDNARRTAIATDGEPPDLRDLARRVTRHLARRGVRELLAGPESGRRRTAEVRRRLARLLERAPALARPALAARHAGTIAALEGPLEVARERRLDALLRADLDDATFARRLGALLASRPRLNDASRPGSPGRLSALLLLHRAPSSASVPRPAPAPAPPSASPGTAAPR